MFIFLPDHASASGSLPAKPLLYHLFEFPQTTRAEPEKSNEVKNGLPNGTFKFAVSPQ
jgi:hypothetical protein